MSKDEFIKQLTDIMDTETELTLETDLSEVEEWDSLSLVSFLSFCNARLRRPILPDEIKSAKNVNDLFSIVSKD